MSATKNLTQAQRAAIALLRARLDWRHPGHRASTEVSEALASARIYMDSWVFPLLDFLEQGEDYHGQTEYIKRDAALAGNAVKRYALEMKPVDRAELEQFARVDQEKTE